MSKANYELFGNMDLLIDWANRQKIDDSNRGVVNNLRNFKVMPTKESLKDIAELFSDKGKIITVENLIISIPELTRAVNSAKDNIITSNGKKVFNMLLPTNEEEYEIANKYFMCSQDRLFTDEEALFEYLKVKKTSQIKTYYYLPGRAVTFKQLYRFGIEYSYIPIGILKEINNLEKNGIVEVISDYSDDSNVTKICRLSFEGCGKLLNE